MISIPNCRREAVHTRMKSTRERRARSVTMAGRRSWSGLAYLFPGLHQGGFHQPGGNKGL
jgi:hypothetical protein